jgi:Zn-dependent peptidase ImmA (M78 family)
VTLASILESVGLSSVQCANLLGVHPSIVDDWTSGRRPIPDSYARELSLVLGVHPEMFLRKHFSSLQGDLAPAVWYKLRAENLPAADRECVFLVRRLATMLDELEETTKKRKVSWESLFEDIRKRTDGQAPPREQGRQAARMFRESRSLSQGARGIGPVLRGNLRSMGLLVVETPIPGSQIDGFAFYVTTASAKRPCVFANSHRSTWFRRNSVLAHEIGHCLFDAERVGASLDFKNGDDSKDLIEQRAQAFAQELLLPIEVLRHLSQESNVRWDSPSAPNLAALVAASHVEQRLIIGAAVEGGLLLPDLADMWLRQDIAAQLRELSDHALTTREYLKKSGKDASDILLGRRSTTIPSRRIRLPVPYVVFVVDEWRNGTISARKASELLMIDYDTFRDRFGLTRDAAA